MIKPNNPPAKWIKINAKKQFKSEQSLYEHQYWLTEQPMGSAAIIDRGWTPVPLMDDQMEYNSPARRWLVRNMPDPWSYSLFYHGWAVFKNEVDALMFTLKHSRGQRSLRGYELKDTFE